MLETILWERSTGFICQWWMVQDYAQSTFPFIRQRDLLLMGIVLGTGYPIEIFPDNWSNCLPPKPVLTFISLELIPPPQSALNRWFPRSAVRRGGWSHGYMPRAPSCSWLLNFIKITKLRWLFHMSNCGCFRDVMQWCLARRFSLVWGDPCFETPLVWIIRAPFIQAYALRYHRLTL